MFAFVLHIMFVYEYVHCTLYMYNWKKIRQATVVVIDGSYPDKSSLYPNKPVCLELL